MVDRINYYVYIITNKNKTVLYTGFTDDLERRIYEHKNKVFKGFAFRYNCDRLIYFEEFIDMSDALHREKQIKKYTRQWKENLINSMNCDWRDLYEDFV